MGANQSSTKLVGGQFVPNPIEPVSGNGGKSPKSNKNSFSKSQLNKLLRKQNVHPQQVARPPPAAASSLEVGKYFVSPESADRSGADLIDNSSSSSMMRQYNELEVGARQPQQQQRANGYIATQNQHHLQQQQTTVRAPIMGGKLQVAAAAAMTGSSSPSSPLSGGRQARQLEQTSAPMAATSGNNFTPSNGGIHHQHHHNRQQQQQLQQQQQSRLMNMQQSRFNCSNTSAAAPPSSSANNTTHQQQQQQQPQFKQKPLKSSCSPSSVGSSAGSSSSTSASFHEPPRAAATAAGLATTTATNGRDRGQAAVQLARIVSTNAPPPLGDIKLAPGGRREQQRKLNTQLANHYASNGGSGGGVLVAAPVATQLDEDSLEYQQQRRQHHFDNSQRSAISATASIRANQQQQQQQQQQMDEIEQFYSRNLHLLTATDHQHHYNLADDSGDFDSSYASNTISSNQNCNQNNNNNNNNSASSLIYDDLQQLAAGGGAEQNSRAFLSAPQQRRYKWPKQQYQYFNNQSGNQTIGQPALAGNHQAQYNSRFGDHKPNQQRPISADYGAPAPLLATHPSSPVVTSLSCNYGALVASPAANESLIYNNSLLTYQNHPQQLEQRQFNLMNDYGQLTTTTPTTPTSERHQDANSRYLAVNKAATISSKPAARKSRNPLAAIFQPFNSNSNSSPSKQISASNTPASNRKSANNHNNHNSNSSNFKQYQSNTIHLTGSKSQQNLLHHQQLQARRLSSGSIVAAAPPGGSLKRIRSSPLTAQQTSYEAMRTIDMYLIRQIARSCMDFEMEQKIELEIRLRELASQALLEARNEIDVLEVEKSLLTSDQRMNCYASQLELQRKQLSNPSLSTDSGRASKTSNRNGGGGGRRDGSLNRRHADEVSSDPKATTRPPPPPSSDVIGGGRPGSPSCSSLSKSSQSSPSKLSPVSGESANSVGGHSSSTGGGGHRSRHSNGQVIRQPSSSTASGTLQRRRNGLSNKSAHSSASSNASKLAKHRERLKQTITSQSNIDCNMVADNQASLSVSELRIPLMWRDVDHFKGRGDYRRYAVFCLLKIGSQIYDTRLISDVDRQMTDLTFEDDVIVFNNVDHEFELTLEVYSCVYLEQFSLSSTPRKLKEKLSNSVSRAMGRRLATQTASANFTKELEAYDKSYRFAMIASARLGLNDAADSIKTYDLQLVSPEAHGRHSTSNQFTGNGQTTASSPAANRFSSQFSNSSSTMGGGSSHRSHLVTTTGNQKDAHKNTLPLFGHFCCKLYVRPDVFDKCVKSGYLRIATINLPDSIGTSNGARQGDELANDSDKRRRQRVRGRSDSPANDDSGKSGSSSNDDLQSGQQTNVSQSIATNDTGSMLRSALAASSKLATISMSTATVHWALLRNFTLHLWQVDELKLQQALRRGHAPQVDISCKQPFCISVDKFTRLLRVSNSSLTLETDKGCFVIAAHNLGINEHINNLDEIGQWLRPIEQMIYDSHIWSAALHHYPPASQRNKQYK